MHTHTLGVRWTFVCSSKMAWTFFSSRFYQREALKCLCEKGHLFICFNHVLLKLFLRKKRDFYSSNMHQRTMYHKQHWEEIWPLNISAWICEIAVRYKLFMSLRLSFISSPASKKFSFFLFLIISFLHQSWFIASIPDVNNNLPSLQTEKMRM